MRRNAGVSFLAAMILCPAAFAAIPTVGFVQNAGELVITADGRAVASYCYQDREISRPYFAHVKAPCGVQVTRNHPPEPDDQQDHDTMHPGIWLAFGDLSGNDYWRLKARVVGGEFIEKPAGGAGKGTFTVRNRYLDEDGEAVVCTEECRYVFSVLPEGYLLLSESRFSSDTGDFYFGDQEEMGLGVRLATSIAVKSGKGGRILDSEGRVNEGQVWGKQAAWCDYSGTVEGLDVGICILPDPANFRECWWHARDYGFMAANPFGVAAFTDGGESRVTVKKGDVFRLRYAVLIHDGFDDARATLRQVYESVYTHKGE